MKDIMQKLAELEATAPKVTKKKMLNEDSTTPPINVSNKPASLKDMFENMAMQKPIPVVGKQGDTAQTGAGFLNVTDNSPAAQALGNALADLAGQKKVQIVMPTQPGQAPAAGQPAQAGATGQPQAGQMQMKEKDEGKPGKNFAKIAKSAGERYGSKAAGERVAGAVRAKLAKQGKLEEEPVEESGLQAYLGNKKYGKDGMDALRKAGREHVGKEKMANIRAKYDKMDESQLDEKLTKSMSAGDIISDFEKSKDPKFKGKSKEERKKQALGAYYSMHPEKSKKKTDEADIPSSSGVDTKGAGLGAGRSMTTLEGAKPDFLDLDKDGNKKEPMKKAAADKNKKKVKESMNHRISAARLEGKSHGLRGHAHSGKRYEDMSEMKAYHEGYKEGLDECYGQGVYETAPAMPPATVGGMASQALDEISQEKIHSYIDKAVDSKAQASNDIGAHRGAMAGRTGSYIPGDNSPAAKQRAAAGQVTYDKRNRGIDMAINKLAKEEEMDEGNAFTAALAKTPKGGKFEVGGKTFTDRTGYDAKVNEYAFESADLDEALVNPMGKVARELRGLKSIAKDTPHAQLPGAMGAGSGAATGIAAAATMGAGAAAFLPIVGAAALGGWGLMKAGQLTGKVLNYLAQKVFGTKEEALEFVKAHLEAARGGETSFQHNGKTYKVSLKPGQISQLYSDIEDLTSQIKDKKLDKSLAPDTAMGKIGAALKEDPVFESLDRQLNALLNESEEVSEGLSVSISKGQQNSPDSVTITAQDQEAEHLLAFVKNAGLGLFGDDHAEPSSAMSVQPSHGAPDEVGAGGIDIGVVDGHDGMMGLMQKLSGIQSGGAEDYADEEGDEEQLYGNHEAADKKDCGCDGECGCDDYDQPSNESTCNECGMMETQCGCSKDKEMVDEVESEDQMEFEVAEDNAPDSGEAESTADENAEAKEDAALAGADSGDEEEMNESTEEDEEDVTESNTFESIYKRLKMLEAAAEEDDEEEDVAEEKTEKKGMSDKQAKFFGKKADKEKVDEWANNAGPGKTVSDTTFEQDIDFMTKVIAGGLNKPKSTGQTTTPIIAGQDTRMHDNPMDWATLAGIKK